MASVAQALHRKGFGKGSVLSVILPNCEQSVVTFLAATSLGMRVTPSNPNGTASELGGVFFRVVPVGGVRPPGAATTSAPPSSATPPPPIAAFADSFEGLSMGLPVQSGELATPHPGYPPHPGYAPPAAPVTPMQWMQVQVPAGTTPGQSMRVQTPSGMMEFVVPMGSAPGSTVSIQVPCPPQGAMNAWPQRAPP